MRLDELPEEAVRLVLCECDNATLCATSNVCHLLCRLGQHVILERAEVDTSLWLKILKHVQARCAPVAHSFAVTKRLKHDDVRRMRQLGSRKTMLCRLMDLACVLEWNLTHNT